MGVTDNRSSGLTRRDVLRFGKIAILGASLQNVVFGCDGGQQEYGDLSTGIAIKNGRVMDPYSGYDQVSDIYIRNDKIVKINRTTAESAEAIDQQSISNNIVIDATGLVVAPGFIDIHAHEGVINKTMECFVLDGVTTMVGGNCGASLFPLRNFFSRLEVEGCLINYASYVGANTLRELAGVPENSAATDNQISIMCEIASEELSNGAIGISFGIQYQPAASWKEILSLGKVAAKYGRITAAHGRDGGVKPSALAALDEMILLSRETGIPHQYSHIGSMLAFSDLIEVGLDHIAEAQRLGIRINADIYGYDAGMSSINAPNLDLGVFDRYNCTASDLEVLDDLILDGQLYMKSGSRFKTIEEYASIRQAFFDGRIEGVPIIIAHTLKWDKIRKACQSPFVCICSDGAVYQFEKETYSGHPRVAGSRSVWLGRFVRQDHITDLMTGLFKVSTMPALILGMSSKGRISVGADADLTIFNPNTVIDRATYGQGFMNPPEGIEYVIVNGNLVVADGKLISDSPSGRPLKCNWRIEGYPSM